MCAPVPPYKWSWKHDKCLKCGTNKKKGKYIHKGNGLCLSCFDKWRATKPNRKQNLINQHKKWYNKVKNTDEHKKYCLHNVKNWQKNNPSAWKSHYRKNHLKEKYYKFILGVARIDKNNKNGMTFRCDGCSKNCLVWYSSLI